MPKSGLVFSGHYSSGIWLRSGEGSCEGEVSTVRRCLGTMAERHVFSVSSAG